MKLFFALACSLVMAGCSQSAPETQAGSGNSVAANSTTTTTGDSAASQGSTTTGSTTSTAPDSTNPQDRQPKDGDDVAVMDTSLGRIVIMFFPDKAPHHVENIKTLAAKGFYDGIKFHRVIPGFMIQTGDPNTKQADTSKWGQGGSGKNVDAEFNDVKHVRGIVSMAREGDAGEQSGAMPGPRAANSASSQFFIVVKDSNFLDGRYSAFGKVVSGMDVADKIVGVPTGEQNRPVDPPVIKSLKIEKWPVK